MADTCPICGVFLEGKEVCEESYEGSTFSFCSQECLEVFQRYPEVYAGELETEPDFLEDTDF